MTSGVIVKPSLINKQGVFAARDFKKGEVVLPWENTKELTEQEYAALSPDELNYIEKQNGKTLLVGKPERYVNHSCEPSTLPKGRCDIASRDIKAGEEITTDYANFYLPDGPFTCSCGAINCRGIITGSSER